MGRPVNAQCEPAGGAGLMGRPVETYDPHIEGAGAR